MDDGIQDRRVVRTKQAVVRALASLLDERRYEEIEVAEIVARANVGRSTFYCHFSGKDDALDASMNWLLRDIAGLLKAKPDEENARYVVDHLWANRALARVILSHPLLPRVRRSLSTIIAGNEQAADGRLPGPWPAQASAAQLALLEGWVKGEFSASPSEIVHRLQTPQLMRV